MKIIVNILAILCGVIILMIAGAPIHAATFNIADGDIAALKAAIVAANSNGETDTVNLAAGGIYTLGTADNTGGAGANGLPIVAADGGHALTINGNGAVIQRNSNASESFRILQISSGAVATLNSLILSNGKSAERGGAILNENGTLELLDCTLRNNSVEPPYFPALSLGGAIFHGSGRLTLRRCTLVGNSATSFASISPASATSEGGGIYNSGGTVEVQLCTFSANSVTASGVPPMPGQPPTSANAEGGAISSSGHLLITNSTFNGNTASGTDVYGTAISSWGTNSSAEISSSIVVGTAPVFRGPIISRGYNLTNGDGAGLTVTTADQVNTDAQLQPLASYGGHTQTHAIAPTSPAVDKGKRNAISSLPATTDQRGLARPVDYPGVGPAGGGDNSDIGAYELGAPQTGTTLTVTTIDDHENGLCSTDDCTLREAIATANALAGDNTIVFAPDVTGTIQLTGALPNLGSNITIEGPDANLLSVRRDTGGNYRVFTISNSTTTGPIVSLKGLMITNGQGTGSPANGGGIYNDRGALRIERCTIAGNKATNAAGVWGVGGSITVVDSTINGNVATGYGGGFFNSAVQGNAALNMSNVTLSDNSANRGGAIYNAGPSGAATVTLQNVTLRGNSSSHGTIYCDGATSKVSPRNSIFNPGAGSPNFITINGATVSSFGHNISSDAAGGDSGTGPGGALTHATDLRNTDPKFDGLLRYAGGGTPTIPLRSDSPAIDGGDQNSAPLRDQRGFVRTGMADIGAFEFGGTLPVTLANISTRLRVEKGDNVLIGGFIVTGSQPKKVIIRAIGPSLPFAGRLSNPTLELYQGGTLIASNNDWQNQPAADRQAVIDSMVAPTNNLESALVRTLPANNTAYTAIVRGANGGTGIGVVEAYDLDRTAGSKLANIATRGFVQTGDNVLIAGTILLGSQSQKVIVRAIGPSLSVPGKMADPTLELRDQNGVVLEGNDNWVDSPNKQAIIDSTIPPTNGKESAIVRTLPSKGAQYTAIVRGMNNTTGIAVVEVYALQ